MSVDFIHQFVPGKSGATILLLHGTGGDENDLMPIGKGLAPGSAILSPRGRVSEHGAARFFARIAPGVFDEKEVRTRAAELAEWIESAIAKYSIDQTKIYALGYSNGANIAAAMMLLHPGVIAGGLLLRPMAVIRPQPLPDLKGAPILISAGQHDHEIPAPEAEALGRLLSEAGAVVDFAMQNSGHELIPTDFQIGKQWFAQLLQNG
jgi:phospholipase/carboxylesterase